MISYPLSRKNSLILAGAGLALVAVMGFAAMQNARAHAASSGPAVPQAKVEEKAQGSNAVEPGTVSQTQAPSDRQAVSEVAVTQQANSTVALAAPSQKSYGKPGAGIKLYDADTPDPDTYKPQPPIIYPSGPVQPPQEICHFAQIMPKNGPPPACGNPVPMPPCHPVQPGVMIACPIIYRGE